MHNGVNCLHRLGLYVCLTVLLELCTFCTASTLNTFRYPRPLKPLEPVRIFSILDVAHLMRDDHFASMDLELNLSVQEMAVTSDPCSRWKAKRQGDKCHCLQGGLSVQCFLHTCQNAAVFRPRDCQSEPDVFTNHHGIRMQERMKGSPFMYSEYCYCGNQGNWQKMRYREHSANPAATWLSLYRKQQCFVCVVLASNGSAADAQYHWASCSIVLLRLLSFAPSSSTALARRL